MKPTSKRRCIGYGPYEGTCTNAAGTPWTSHLWWCPRCDELRRATITRQLERILASFEERREGRR